MITKDEMITMMDQIKMGLELLEDIDTIYKHVEHIFNVSESIPEGEGTAEELDDVVTEVYVEAEVVLSIIDYYVK